MRHRGGSRAAATSKMECFAIKVNGWKPLTIIAKHSIFDVAAALDQPLKTHLLELAYNNLNLSVMTENMEMAYYKMK